MLRILRFDFWSRFPSTSTARHVLYGVILGFSLSLTSTSLALYYQSRKRALLAAQFEARPIELRSDEVLRGVTGLIGELSSFQVLVILFKKTCSREHTTGQNKLTERCSWGRDIRQG